MFEMLSEETEVYFRGKATAARFFILHPYGTFCISYHSDTYRLTQWIKKTPVRRWEESKFQSASTIVGARGPRDTPDHAVFTSDPDSSAKVTETSDSAVAHPSR